MISLDDQTVFEKYYQASYDFNTSSLSEKEIDEIKQLAKEKRVNYALAPIGDKIFEFIREQNSDLHFELIDLVTDLVDGMLYIPKSGDDKAYIILNGNKPLINQIFAAAHEFFHYIKDYESIKKQPYICCLTSLKDINEKKASRFAAELLLPEEALKSEIKFFKNAFFSDEKKSMSFDVYAAISVMLTIKYQIPLKATIYRLHEEGYIDNIDKFLKNYDVIKRCLTQVKILKSDVDRLYAKENRALDNRSILYRQMEEAYNSGLASRQEIIEDAKELNLNLDIINSYFDIIGDEDEEDAGLDDFINRKWGE